MSESSVSVSIVTPAYNAGLHLDETIASVRAQTFEDWEWLIVTDGPCDALASFPAPEHTRAF